MPACRKRSQRFVGMNDATVLAQKRDAIGQQIERIFQCGFAMGTDLQACSHVMRFSQMWTKALHQ